MKRIYLFSALLCFVAVTVVFSCKKKATDQSLDMSHLNELFSGLQSSPQHFSINAGRDTFLIGKDSTVLHFYPNTFKNISGNIVSSGVISIELIEMYTVGDMVANRASTGADGKLLQSTGQVNIKAIMNGEELEANKFGVAFRQPGPSTKPMELYFGNKNSADSTVTWTVGKNTTPGTKADGTVSDTSLHPGSGGTSPYHFPGFMYLFDSCTHFHYINSDNLVQSSKNTHVYVEIADNSFNGSNTEVFLTFPSINGAIPYGSYNDVTHIFKSWFEVPVGNPFKVVAMANKNGLFYYCEQAGIATDSLTIHATLTPETLGDIKARLKGL